MRTSLDYIETVIPPDHLCRSVKEVVFSLDAEPIEAKYSFLGQHTYHPKLLLSLLFYGYATGVRSSRKLAQRCISDHVYIYLMQCYTPDHHTAGRLVEEADRAPFATPFTGEACLGPALHQMIVTTPIGDEIGRASCRERG